MVADVAVRPERKLSAALWVAKSMAMVTVDVENPLQGGSVVSRANPPAVARAGTRGLTQDSTNHWTSLSITTLVNNTLGFPHLEQRGFIGNCRAAGAKMLKVFGQLPITPVFFTSLRTRRWGY